MLFRSLLVWADNLDDIIPLAHELDDKLIKLIWRARLPQSTAASVASAGSIGTLGVLPGANSPSSSSLDEKQGIVEKAVAIAGTTQAPQSQPATLPPKPEIPTVKPAKKKFKFGWRTTVQEAKEKRRQDVEKADGKEPRPIRLFAPIYGGLGCALSICEFVCRVHLSTVAFLWAGTDVNCVLQSSSVVVSAFSFKNGSSTGRRLALLCL